MKRSTKLITLLLIASMALSVCACDIRRKGVDRIMLDEYDKPEHSVETTIPEPTETEPAPTEPDPTRRKIPAINMLHTLKLPRILICP